LDFEKKTNGGVTNSAEHINWIIDTTIERLGSPPDLYYLHRMVPEETPLEVSIKALDGLRKAGKCKYIGLSEPSAETLEKACQSGSFLPGVKSTLNYADAFWSLGLSPHALSS
jgi:aryl-alcohol dehydrogenase-like predicted oxidoreductase